ncbi:EamA family transporter [Pseudomonas sp. YY-1]|uniref:DMT family transporter n=1 Tax=Pseudomonas sp. YY-1 TaxID=2058659 RepID=UPI000CB31358|nr:DMT family transporter [Pseudomonas sp. YY-1]PKQ39620.1 EamA family transporter [Pseudomonas sp. YY-1]
MNALTASYRRSLDNGVLFAVLSATGFSLKAVFVKLAYAAAPVDAITVLSLRMGLALPLFAWLLWLSRGTGQARLSAKDWAHVLLLGMLGYYLSSLFDFYGLQYISAGLERLILFTYPTLVLLLQMLALGERPGPRTFLAMGLCYLGLGIALVHDIRVEGDSEQILLGAAWVFASAVTYALYYLGTGVVIRRVGSMRLAGLAGGSSAIMVLIHYAISGEPTQLASLPNEVWLYSALMAVLPIYWMALAIQRMGASHTAVFGNLGPVLTMFAAWALLGEAISLYQIAGLALVLLGVSRLSSGKRKTG